MITEDYVSFEIAKLLKEKGFGGDCFSMYVISKPHSGIGNPNKAKIAPHGRDSHYYEGYEYQCEAPTLQMAMKWLREEKHIPIEILWHYDADSDVEEWYFIHHAELRILPNDIEYYETYEGACEAAIRYCLENLI